MSELPGSPVAMKIYHIAVGYRVKSDTIQVDPFQ